MFRITLLRNGASKKGGGKKKTTACQTGPWGTARSPLPREPCRAAGCLTRRSQPARWAERPICFCDAVVWATCVGVEARRAGFESAPRGSDGTESRQVPGGTLLYGPAPYAGRSLGVRHYRDRKHLVKRPLPFLGARARFAACTFSRSSSRGSMCASIPCRSSASTSCAMWGSMPSCGAGRRPGCRAVRRCGPTSRPRSPGRPRARRSRSPSWRAGRGRRSAARVSPTWIAPIGGWRWRLPPGWPRTGRLRIVA